MWDLEKSIKDIPKGVPVPQHGSGAYDYSHLLNQDHQDAVPGAKIIVSHHDYGRPTEEDKEIANETGWPMSRGTITAHLRSGEGAILGRVVAHVGYHNSKAIPGQTVVPLIVSHTNAEKAPKSHAGRRLYFGRRLYEAAMAHAANHLGATHVVGGVHSSIGRAHV